MKNIAALATILDELANGGTVTLGDFGDNANAEAADEQADILRAYADDLRAGKVPA